MKFVFALVVVGIILAIVTSRSCDFTGKEELEAVVDQASDLKDAVAETLDEHIVDCDDPDPDEGGAGSLASPKAFRCSVTVGGWHIRATDIQQDGDVLKVNLWARQIEAPDRTDPVFVKPSLRLPGGAHTEAGIADDEGVCSALPDGGFLVEDASVVTLCFSSPDGKAGVLRLNEEWLSLDTGQP